MFPPESVNPLNLPSVTLSDRQLLPEMPAIYFVIDQDGRVQYIGKSVNLANRWYVHHKSQDAHSLKGARIAWLAVSNCRLLTGIEQALINHFNPPLNQKHHEYTAMAALRYAAGITREEVAYKLKISITEIANWEHGRTIPKLRLDQFSQLLQLYSCTFEELEQAMKESMSGGNSHPKN